MWNHVLCGTMYYVELYIMWNYVLCKMIYLLSHVLHEMMNYIK